MSLIRSTRHFGRLSAVAGPITVDGDGWARLFLAEELKPHVPDGVRELFDVARGCLLYGWFFNPLFRLGEEQLFRVAEAAARERYHELGGPKKRPTFAASIAWLTNEGAIKAGDEIWWDATRELRNHSSHPERHVAMPPGQVLRTLSMTAHRVNRLFLRDPRAP